ncbi:MAG: hypothetical protein SGILL_001494 [Bacillariaceae sp.]
MSEKDAGANGEYKNRALQIEDDDLAASMQLDVDIDIEDGDSGDDNDDDNSNVLFVVSRANFLGNQPKIPTKPSDDLVWDDNAITDCWSMTLAAYTPNGSLNADTVKTSEGKTEEEITEAKESKSSIYEQYKWKAPKLQTISNGNKQTKSGGDNKNTAETITSILKDWKPKSLPIPSWAVDPVEATAVLQKEAGDGSGIIGKGGGEDEP